MVRRRRDARRLGAAHQWSLNQLPGNSPRGVRVAPGVWKTWGGERMPSSIGRGNQLGLPVGNDGRHVAAMGVAETGGDLPLLPALWSLLATLDHHFPRCLGEVNCCSLHPDGSGERHVGGLPSPPLLSPVPLPYNQGGPSFMFMPRCQTARL